jgi:hypothetical protein
MDFHSEIGGVEEVFVEGFGTRKGWSDLRGIWRGLKSACGTDRRLLIRDADIAKIIGSVGDLQEWLAARSNMR